MVDQEKVIRVDGAAVVEISIAISGESGGESGVDLGVIVGIDVTIDVGVAGVGIFDEDGIGVHRFAGEGAVERRAGANGGFIQNDGQAGCSAGDERGGAGLNSSPLPARGWSAAG